LARTATCSLTASTGGPPVDTVSATSNFGVLEYNGTTGVFITTFVGSGANGVQAPRGLAFDQDGRLYVADWGTSAILRFDSQGNFIDDEVTPGAGSASSLEPFGMVFNAQGALLVSNQYENSVVQYNSGVMATLSAVSTSPVTVQYATADGTAVAGTDYTAQTGTVTFAPGQTSRLIPLVTLYDATPPANDYFNLALSNPSGATIANGNAVVTITPPTLPQLAIGNDSAIEGDPTAHYRGAAAYGASTEHFNPVTIGPDGNIYTATGGGDDYNMILRYNGTTGAFMGIFATGPINGAREIVFNGGYMYVASTYTNQVLQYNGTTGAYLGVFVTAGSGGINGPDGMTFGPDGNLYVTGTNSNNVVCYNGTTGALIKTFVAAGSGGLNLPAGLTFDPSGSYLDVAEWGGSNEVLKYNGQTGAYVGVAAGGLSSPRDVKFGANGLLYVLDAGTNRIEEFTENGAYVSDYVPAGSGGMSSSGFMTFGPNGDLYVNGGNINSIVQFGTENEALFTVSLSAPFAEPVTVNYTTANGTALAGTNYTATSGTRTFPAGITTETIRVPILDSGTQTTSLTFTLNLSNPEGGTLSNSQAVGTIEPSDLAAKFYVVDSNTSTYKYQASGTEQAPYALSLADLDPIGIAANAAGTKEWIVDRNENVYVYSPGGTLLGSWSAGGLPSGASLNGIATDGTNIWLLDATTNKIFEYVGAASRLSGSQNAASSFKLNRSDNGAANIVTDGTSLWTVDNGNGKVFKYTVSGSLLGSWKLDPADVDPIGITIDPNNVSNIWTVDGYTLKVYQYTAAATRTSGSQNAAVTFALAPGDTIPEGIADPPPADMLLTTTEVAQPSTSTAQPLAFSGADGSWIAELAPANRGASLIVGDPGPSNRLDLLSGPSFEVGLLLGYDSAEENLVGVSAQAGSRQMLAGGPRADNLDPLDQVYANSSFLFEQGPEPGALDTIRYVDVAGSDSNTVNFDPNALTASDLTSVSLNGVFRVKFTWS
jgi:sugar lactone lactonase YvrE